MNRAQINRAYEISSEIDKLERFIEKCKVNYLFLKIFYEKRFKLFTDYFDSHCDELSISTELSERILKTIEEYVEEHKKQLEEM